MISMSFTQSARGLAMAVALFAAVLAYVPSCPGIAAAQPPTQINVEIDYMSDGTHSHAPTQAEINAIVQMFACHGITLNAVIDDAVPHVTVMPDSSGGPPNFFTWLGINSFRWYRQLYFDNSGGGWHYCIFAHQYDPEGPATSTGSSGLAEPGGDDFIVTLGTFAGQVGTPFDRAATFAHELGHNLELNHYAGSDTSYGDYSPNYASIMSYQYQLTGIRTQMKCLDLADTTVTNLLKEIDYSNGRFPSVNENALSEPRGVGVRTIDWNCNGAINGTVAKDLDGRSWCSANGLKGFLNDQNDWALIDDNTQPGQQLPPSSSVMCISSDEMEQIRMDPSTCSAPQPTLVVEPCQNALMVWVSAANSGFENGWGDFPYNTLMEAYNAAPFGSALYLQPTGSYNTGGVVTLSKPLTIAGPGVVTITP